MASVEAKRVSSSKTSLNNSNNNYVCLKIKTMVAPHGKIGKDNMKGSVSGPPPEPGLRWQQLAAAAEPLLPVEQMSHSGRS